MPHDTLKRILLVDDEEDIRTIAKLALETIAKLEVVDCADSQCCIDSALTFQPQIILLDVMMPVMDGPAVLQKLQETEELKHIPVVFFTAKASPAEMEALTTLGAVAVMSKPFNPMALGDELKLIWSELQSQPAGQSESASR